MTLARKLVLIALPLAALAASGACTSSPGTSGAPGAPPARTAPHDPTLPTPTPTPIPMSRTNPNIVEETATYYIERLPKKDYIRVSEREIRHPAVAGAIEFLREDDEYYYVYTKKFVPELDAPTPRPAVAGAGASSLPPALQRTPRPRADFDDLQPPRVAGRVRLAKVEKTGLPDGGLWRASFVLADVNGDKRLDIVAPPSRIGPEPVLHIWLGKGDGSFERWKLEFVSGDGSPVDSSLDYGGVAAGDIDGDGHMDVAAASHGGGLVTLFGDGTQRFRVVRGGLTGAFSSQAVALLDADGDRKLDMVGSRDVLDSQATTVDTKQVRLYRYRGAEGWAFDPEAIDGGFYSNVLSAWDYDKDGRTDVLTGSHYDSPMTLLWRNTGTKFDRVSDVPLEPGYHFSTAPGRFGADRRPAFADAYYAYDRHAVPAQKATGISVYAFSGGAWTRHRVWRKRDGGSSQYALALGDLDGDGLDDVVFPDSEARRLRIFFQTKEGGFEELAEAEEPTLASPGQCARLADINGDGRLDVVLSRTVSSTDIDSVGGWDVFLNSPVRR